MGTKPRGLNNVCACYWSVFIGRSRSHLNVKQGVWKYSTHWLRMMCFEAVAMSETCHWVSLIVTSVERQREWDNKLRSQGCFQILLCLVLFSYKTLILNSWERHLNLIYTHFSFSCVGDVGETRKHILVQCAYHTNILLMRNKGCNIEVASN